MAVETALKGRHVAPLTECLPTVREGLLGFEHHTEFSIQGVAAEGSEADDYLWLHSRFEASLHFMRPCLQNKRQFTKETAVEVTKRVP